jgi:hypothetical protein
MIFYRNEANDNWQVTEFSYILFFEPGYEYQRFRNVPTSGVFPQTPRGCGATVDRWCGAALRTLTMTTKQVFTVKTRRESGPRARPAPQRCHRVPLGLLRTR